MANIIERFQAQTISSNIHRQFGGPLERQCNCLRVKNGYSSFINLCKRPDQKKAYYKGLQTCGSVYSCPVCASKITEYRKSELEYLLDMTQAQGKYHYLITLTIPHYKNQSCKTVRDKFISARRKFKNWDFVKYHSEFVPYKQIMNHYGLDGSVTTVEVTYGRNGWHIHSHELVILNNPVKNLKKFRNDVFANWTKALLYAGVKIKSAGAFYKRSVRIDELKGDHTNVMTSYLTKTVNNKNWGVTSELSKGNLKRAQSNNITPFGMLYLINDEHDFEKKKVLYNKYASIFYEYCKTFKGKQSLYFSKGLKSKYSIADLKDEEIVKMEDLIKEFYGFFTTEEWTIIKKLSLRGWIIENSDKSWEKLKIQLDNEIILREANRHAKKTANKTFFKKVG